MRDPRSVATTKLFYVMHVSKMFAQSSVDCCEVEPASRDFASKATAARAAHAEASAREACSAYARGASTQARAGGAEEARATATAGK